MAVDAELEEMAMVASGVPDERAAAEIWVVRDLTALLSHHTSLNDGNPDEHELARKKARTLMIGVLLNAVASGISASELQGEFSAAFGEVFDGDGSVRGLGSAHGWKGWEPPSDA